MRVHLIVIGLVESGACSGHDILTSLVLREVQCPHWIGCHLGKFRRSRGEWGSIPNETMICALTEDFNQPGAQGSCYTRLSAWGKHKVL